jgi:hypothetical protein
LWHEGNFVTLIKKHHRTDTASNFQTAAMLDVSNDLINTKYTNKHLKELMTILSGMVHKPNNLNIYWR